MKKKRLATLNAAENKTWVKAFERPSSRARQQPEINSMPKLTVKSLRAAAATRKGRRAARGSVAREQMHCPKCDWPGVYIRTRYFKTMTADVWMCDNSKCESYRLYWHDDKPLNK